MVDAIKPQEEKVLANYDHSDIEDNSGNVTYFLYKSKETTNLSYHLGKDLYYSNETTESSTGTTLTERNWDTGTFNGPRTIVGTAILNLVFWSFDTGNNATATWTIKLYRVRAAAEVQLGSTWVSEAIDDASPTATKYTGCAEFVIPRTEMIEGDSLRLSITGTSTNTGNFGYGCDPQNRAGGYLDPAANPSTDFTNSNITIPFRIIQ